MKFQEFLTCTLPRFLGILSAAALAFIFVFVNVASVHVLITEAGMPLLPALFVVGRDFVGCVVDGIVWLVRFVRPALVALGQVALFAFFFAFFNRLFEGWEVGR